MRSKYFSKKEIVLWSSSVAVIVSSFCIFDGTSAFTPAASLIGVTSLILCAKGNPLGQVLMIVFSLLYGGISFSSAYYGEMITYLGMTMPMAVISLISWLKNPYNGKKSEVKVNNMKKKEVAGMCAMTVPVTFGLYLVLDYFHTANIVPGTISVATSFIAAYLTFKRSPYFALAYAANDVVLIFLWILASRRDTGYVSVVVCFVVFLINDLYGFISWRKMKQRQETELKKDAA